MFSASDPKQILAELSLLIGRDISVDRSLLFLDEIQAAGAILGKFRWFAEEFPNSR